MKKIALISSFCDNEEKVDLLKENIIKIKSLSVDVMVFSPLKLPDDLISLCDYVIISKENPTLNWPEKAYFQWWAGRINGKKIKMSTTYPDYGYAGLVQVKRMADLAISVGYDIYFPMIYDIKIDEYVENIFRDTKTKSFFPSQRGDMIWVVGLHLMSLNEENLIKLKTFITKESYLVESDFDAFAWLHRVIKLLPGKIEDRPIEDLIYFLENKNFFDCELTKKYKCFIHKTDFDNMKLVFYGYGGIKNFEIKSNDYQKNLQLREWEQIELPFINTDSLLITHDGEEIDYGVYIKNIGQNKLEIQND